MLEYKSLEKFKYGTGTQSFSDEEIEKEYQNRINGYSTRVTNIYPYLIDRNKVSSNHYPLFIVETVKINELFNEIQAESKNIERIAEKLPGIAQSGYINSLLQNEIFFTNEIEGVKTNKEEIGTIIGDSVSKKRSKRRRLESTIRRYQAAIAKKDIRIEKLEDIRKLYDDLLDGELADDVLPDGKLFRNSKVYIGGETEIIFNPPANEELISIQLTKLIELMNNDSINFLERAFITHFVFENTHPFRDGNGRMGRYLLSSYLSKKLDQFTALSISSAIHIEVQKYYRIFKDADNLFNKADLTIFITEMAKIVLNGQRRVSENLLIRKELLDHNWNHLSNRFDNLSENEKTVLNILLQSKLFSNDDSTGVQDREIINFLNSNDHKRFPRNTVKNAISLLEDRKIIQKIKSAPLQHVLLDEYIEKEFNK
ncbi:Fic family protein [Companilactobacillus nodensis]|uniref:Fic family protein n=1 Tax=Companilactobacillus nodensis DSM 19682 = JCM 14932 = NBRC 107160 TaxID=1423775 RepID=A0A0R1KBY1_9LACO|nr:Fic family protein [Companilactobacillus nodensis]KRK81149.1 Fic family protein [Companilactobacillus nodensis DSM 19682 = JCM 14932 = NBRC 107160]